uniref:Uncharacterized protein n=1 Tax=Panagrolaimus superbus TaxID=310955 RepID=A0A914ZCM7_9BILA
MHARRPQSRRVPTSIGGTAIAYDAGSRNDPNMKYVRLVSANEQASTSYAMTTNFQPPQELFPNAQIITGTSPDGAIVEYVIDQRDFDPSGIPPTMYVEVMPNIHAPEQQEEEPQLNEEEVLAIENGYLNAIDAPVKKSRYSRMSEADRERYNARRRQRRLEKKKKKMEEDELAKAVEESLVDNSEPVENIVGQQEAKVPIVQKTEQIITTNISPMPPQFSPIPDMKTSVGEEKTSRTETARNRYHAMTEEERRLYNQKRASAFRKKRKEEEILLSTTPECSSPGRITRAQEIVIRNARRAEKARQRYQRMTVEERREYNQRRTIAKKARRLAKSQALREAAALGQHQRQPLQRPQQHPRQQSRRPQQQPPLQNPSQSSNLYVQQRAFDNGINTDIVNEEALLMLERDVVRRTQVAQMALRKQRKEKQNRPYNTIDDTIEQVATYGAALPLNEPKDHTVVENVQDYIEPSTLPLVIVDQHGNPANLPEGSIIEVRQEHPNGPQTIIIHTAPPPPPNHRFIQPPTQPSMIQFVTTSVAQNALPLSNYVQEEQALSELKPSSNDSPELPKSEILRVRRAARARERYHQMGVEERKQFNSRRAVALRKARVRDEELCRLGEDARKSGNELNNDTMKAINDAQQRRAKRAESARLKYQRMTVEERRIYNANRDANRRAKKRDSEPFESNEKNETLKSEEPLEYSFE